jgi:hypothetical protein
VTLDTNTVTRPFCAAGGTPTGTPTATPTGTPGGTPTGTPGDTATGSPTPGSPTVAKDTAMPTESAENTEVAPPRGSGGSGDGSATGYFVPVGHPDTGLGGSPSPGDPSWSHWGLQHSSVRASPVSRPCVGGGAMGSHEALGGVSHSDVRYWKRVAAVLAALALTFLTFAEQSPSQSPAGSPSTGPAVGGSVTAASSEPEAPRSAVQETIPPVRLRIPAIDVVARTIGLGLNPDRTVEVPSLPMDSGWYRFGPAPGQPGSAVILGHVDSPAGPAVFADLRHLRRGDLVHVEGADGSTSTFGVRRVATYPNESFPANEVYAAPGRVSALNLVTCGGEYDAESGYQANVVVFTELHRGT